MCIRDSTKESYAVAGPPLTNLTPRGTLRTLFEAPAPDPAAAVSHPAGTGGGGRAWPGTKTYRSDVKEEELTPRAKRHRAAAAAAFQEVEGGGPATMLLPPNLQAPHASDEPPAWLVGYDAIFRRTKAEPEAEDAAAAEHRARVAAAAPKGTIFVGGESRVYGPIH